MPLMFGMPVAVTEHINRSCDRRILEGRVGHIHSWVLALDERSVYEDNVRILHKLLKAVFVFAFAKDGTYLLWTLPGLTVKGLYPITPSTGTWLVLGKTKPSTSCLNHQQTTTSVNAGVRDDVACRARANLR